MALNPYFQQGAKNEQSLVQSLINEQLRMYGVNVHYMPRKYMTTNTIIKEVVESKFDDAYPIEAYVEDIEGYGENPTLLSKFGIQQTNELTLTISKERFETYVSPLMKNEDGIKLATRPKEGDLIYFPLGDRLFEIKYVEHEKPFYQLRNTYVYTLRCELFQYEDEVIDTGVDEIDDTLESTEGVDGGDFIIGGTQVLTMVGTASSATAATMIVNGGIQYVDISNRGNSYLYAPRIGISSAPAGGVTGVATAYLRSGIVVCAGAGDPDNQKASVVQNVYLVNPGAGYTTGPDIEFYSNGDGGTGAAATAGMSNGGIGIVTVTGGGSGYTTSPVITFEAQNGISTTGAAATAVVSAAGTISAVYISNAGAGYTVAPTVFIAPPATSDASGNFAFNEVVTGGTSGTTARVRKWNAVTNELDVSTVEGSGFVNGEIVTGASSGATQSIRTIDLTNFDDGYGENDEFETQADNILDFSEGNPFGQP
tara:strand:+ start:30878 stop:32323 length:1446 start_codon:yes stop_codon:yes gene_type:complete